MNGLRGEGGVRWNWRLVEQVVEVVAVAARHLRGEGSLLLEGEDAAGVPEAQGGGAG